MGNVDIDMANYRRTWVIKQMNQVGTMPPTHFTLNQRSPQEFLKAFARIVVFFVQAKYQGRSHAGSKVHHAISQISEAVAR
jgi:hypothetical protein